MFDVSTLGDSDKDKADAKARALVEEGAVMSGPLLPEHEDAVRNIFKVMHGWYGNLFLSRYITGLEIESGPNKGEDEGIVNARRMWGFALRTFRGRTIKDALSSTRTAHPEYPPTLPQFEALCKARMPRRRIGNGLPLIGMSQELVSQYARQARAINERHRSRRAQDLVGVRDIEPGLTGLKQAIAAAVADAGGDEAAALLRLDRELPTKASHE